LTAASVVKRFLLGFWPKLDWNKARPGKHILKVVAVLVVVVAVVGCLFK